MFNISNISRLPEYRGQAIEMCDYSKVDINEDPQFVDDNVLVDQILGINSDTGWPNNDIDILTNTNNTEVRDYLLRCIKSLRPIDNSDLTDEDLEKLHYSKFDSPDSYVDRLKSMIENVKTE